MCHRPVDAQNRASGFRDLQPRGGLHGDDQAPRHEDSPKGGRYQGRAVDGPRRGCARRRRGLSLLQHDRWRALRHPHRHALSHSQCSFPLPGDLHQLPARRGDAQLRHRQDGLRPGIPNERDGGPPGHEPDRIPAHQCHGRRRPDDHRPEALGRGVPEDSGCDRADLSGAQKRDRGKSHEQRPQTRRGPRLPRLRHRLQRSAQSLDRAHAGRGGRLRRGLLRHAGYRHGVGPVAGHDRRAVRGDQPAPGPRDQRRFHQDRRFRSDVGLPHHLFLRQRRRYLRSGFQAADRGGGGAQTRPAAGAGPASGRPGDRRQRRLELRAGLRPDCR